MQPQIAGAFAGIFALIYLACVIAVVIYVLILLGRFVKAQERTAGALETIARKLRDGNQPGDMP